MSVLLIVTNHEQLGKTGKKTGYYLPEAAHPYYVFVKNGFKVVFASPNGGKSPCDEGSIKAFEKDEECVKFLNDKSIQDQLENTHKISELNPKDFVAAVFVGGHGPVFDIPEHKPTQDFVSAVYENSGVVGAICHGPACLVNIKLSNGEYLVKDKTVCGFTNKEEDLVQLTNEMPFLLETKLIERGAKFEGAEPWQCNVKVSERLVTGQNPASAGPSAEATVKLLKK